MCGILGIYGDKEDINIEVYEGLQALQHRGQDSVGIANAHTIVKYSGLVKDNFTSEDLNNLRSNCCIGHVRYGTNGLINNIQPLYSTFPRRITLCHNGNIINTAELTSLLKRDYNIITYTGSDTEIILTLFCCKLYSILNGFWYNSDINISIINQITTYLHEVLQGSFSLIILIQDYGMVVIRDRRGIRPLIWGRKDNKHIISSESSALTLLDYEQERDIFPGETLIFENRGIRKSLQYNSSNLIPCLFEYIYFSRPDSVVEKINVTEARIKIGKLLGEKILKNWPNHDIDIIVPVPDTSVIFATGIQDVLQIPVRHGFIKNRYVDRTFIMKNSQIITKNIKRKLSPNKEIIANKNILIIDDSIVRGNTCRHIIQQARKCNAKKIYFASCAPIVKNTNQYGIYIPTKTELLAFDKSVDEMKTSIGADYLIFNDLKPIMNELRQMNPKIDNFEISMFK
tara:strand:+ start:3646 stop:5016 length:1371 start_codon:yes stop_codon:yes gene_type:complete